MRNIIILIPSLHPTGPVKGAIALANALIPWRKVILVVLKPGPGVHILINAEVEVVCLYEKGGWLKRLRAYKRLLNGAGGRNKVASISSCFSADVFNLLSRKHALICSSVRGNLLYNYRLDYGWKGTALAVLHLFLMRGFHHVVAMTQSMANQVSGYLGYSPAVIGNFVDEETLEPYRQNLSNSETYRFVFVGSLTKRKRPFVLIDALETLKLQGYDVSADFIGDGPLRDSIDKELSRRGLINDIHIHGHLNKLHHLVASADAFVLPSLSEGVSRACMEALYLGIPSVLRDVDGNSELIQDGSNGFLFNSDEDLPAAMISAAELSRKQKGKVLSLLPSNFRQAFAAKAYLSLMESKS